jgi:hypothetical protein
MRPGGGRARLTGRPRAGWTPVFAFAIASLVSAWGLVASNAASGSAVPLPPTMVVSVSATPSMLPAAGGSVTITGTVQNATSCER